MAFREIKAEELQFNPFTKIGKEWMLVTAGDEKKHNTMTASWGAMGVMWGKNVVSVYLRPQRYTKEFVDAGELFTVSFYSEDHRGALNICGTKSGRDCDKEKPASFFWCIVFFLVYSLLIQIFPVIQKSISGTRISEGRFLRELLRCPAQEEGHSR